MKYFMLRVKYPQFYQKKPNFIHRTKMIQSMIKYLIQRLKALL